MKQLYAESSWIPPSFVTEIPAPRVLTFDWPEWDRVKVVESTVLYLAGPMRGYKDFNFAAFGYATSLLRASDYDVFSPAERDIDLYGEGFNLSPNGDPGDLIGSGFDLREALAADTAFVARHADGVATLNHWHKSRGARAEVALARALDLPVRPWWEWVLDVAERAA